MRKYLLVIISLVAIKLAIHLPGNGNYGFHRDELLHLSVSEHLATGYFEFPPFIAFLGKFAHELFGYDLFWIRMFSTLAGVLILILTCLMTYKIGGKLKAVIVSGVLILAFVPFYRNHLLFQPVAFDQLFWTLSFFFTVLYLKDKKNLYLVLLGISLGLGFLNKYIIFLLIVSLFIALVITQREKIIKNKWFYLSGIIALMMVLPNLFWQYEHHFPVFLHFQKLKESQLDATTGLDFLKEQVASPFTFIMALLGLISVFFIDSIKRYKAISIAVLLVFVSMWLLKSKGYYFFSAYPVLFSFAGFAVETITQKRKYIYYIITAIVLLPSIYFIPEAIPVLPIPDFIKYENLKPDANGRYRLTGDYADMFGWEEQVQLVDSIYKTFPEEKRKSIGIMAENYGEAGAITILGKACDLPQPVCAHGSFWTFGPGEPKVAYITIGLEPEIVDFVFKERKRIKTIHHPYAIDEENGIPVYICSKPSINFKEFWPTLESKVFN
ncbi:hypothetical protein DI487_01655 [Flavobacterium sediminis]|uniref:Glycosyltransferase RgtA/B/C/D-like domain-containing protein n=1 Tax=Flavobacterium sediminis TaxID=2201181 RepID=A0A2U8QRG9_9FLAO|nr:glycosyltransferase family 39 protein [Flavobacterium sediminis]AWM12701.1 hypothetical protein DI487_01655 [Flavobacterium sediminis]